MSSLYVRDTVRGWLKSASGIVLPFFDTINAEVDPPLLNAPWSTLVFVSANSTKITYCGLMEERGTFDFVALGQAGVGDRDLIAAAENDVAILLAQIDAPHRLTLLRATPPEDFLQAGSTPWYTVSMVIDYLYEQPISGTTATVNKGANHAAA